MKALECFYKLVYPWSATLTDVYYVKFTIFDSGSCDLVELEKRPREFRTIYRNMRGGSGGDLLLILYEESGIPVQWSEYSIKPRQILEFA